MIAGKGIITSFLDGLTGEGIFGDLRIPGTPDSLFEEEPEHKQEIKEGDEPAERVELRSSDKTPGSTRSDQLGKR
jgi:hypothetical protein